MSYVTVFDITNKGFQWWWTAFGLIFVGVGAALIKFGPKLYHSKPGTKHQSVTVNHCRLIGLCVLIFASGYTALVFDSTYSRYREYINAYRAGQYSLVEGLVEEFRPMPYEGHQDECFRV